jgi:hypothetical protein
VKLGVWQLRGNLERGNVEKGLQIRAVFEIQRLTAWQLDGKFTASSRQLPEEMATSTRMIGMLLITMNLPGPQLGGLPLTVLDADPGGSPLPDDSLPQAGDIQFPSEEEDFDARAFTSVATSLEQYSGRDSLVPERHLAGSLGPLLERRCWEMGWRHPSELRSVTSRASQGSTATTRSLVERIPCQPIEGAQFGEERLSVHSALPLRNCGTPRARRTSAGTFPSPVSNRRNQC